MYLDPNTGATIYWPAGFVCYHNGTTTVTTPYGKSNYTSAPGSATVPDLTKIISLTTSAVAGYVPDNSDYIYTWSISSTADKTDPTNWSLEAMYSSSTALTR